jgi:hypothetical protein
MSALRTRLHDRREATTPPKSHECLTLINVPDRSEALVATQARKRLTVITA